MQLQHEFQVCQSFMALVRDTPHGPCVVAFTTRWLTSRLPQNAASIACRRLRFNRPVSVASIALRKAKPIGKRAKQAASALTFGKEVTLQTYGKDKYGRTLADVLLSNGTNVNHELVKEGW